MVDKPELPAEPALTPAPVDVPLVPLLPVAELPLVPLLELPPEVPLPDPEPPLALPVPDVEPPLVPAPLLEVLPVTLPAEPADVPPDVPAPIALPGILPKVTIPVVTTWLIGGCGTIPPLTCAAVTAVADGLVPALVPDVLVLAPDAGVVEAAAPFDAVPVALVEVNATHGFVPAAAALEVFPVVEVAGVLDTDEPVLAVEAAPAVPAGATTVEAALVAPAVAAAVGDAPAEPTVSEALGTAGLPLVTALVPLAAAPGVALEAEPFPTEHAARSIGTATKGATRRIADARDNISVLLTHPSVPQPNAKRAARPTTPWADRPFDGCTARAIDRTSGTRRQKNGLPVDSITPACLHDPYVSS